MSTGTHARVALLQVRSDATESVAARTDRVLDVVDVVAAGEDPGWDVCVAEGVELPGKPDLVMLPEMWTVGAFDTEAMMAHAEAIPSGPTVSRLREVARRHGVWIHAGAFPEITADGARFNTSVVVAANGSVAALYRKIHLFGFDEGEAARLGAGSHQVVTPLPVGDVGLTTCYDLRFPELYRALTASGAEVFAVPAGWPLRRIEHWRVLIQARAIENQAWVLAVNGVGEHAGVALGGRSAVVDPWGEVIAEASPDSECIVLADLPLDAVESTRSSFPVLRDRRV